MVFIIILSPFCIVEIMNSPTFFTSIVGTITGMICGMFITPTQIKNHFWIGILLVFLWMFFLRWYFSIKKTLGLGFLFFICIAIGFLRVDSFHSKYSFTDFDRYHNQKITVVGIVRGPPVYKPGVQLIKIHPQVINGNNIDTTTRDIVFKISDLELFSPGDQVVFSGTFKTRLDFESNNGRIVEYRLMSYSKKIAGDIVYPKILVHKKNNANVLQVFSSIKKSFIQSLNNVFLSPVSGLLSGIIIGDTSGIDSTMTDIFRSVGLIHIIVLSGYNITLVANFFVRIFSLLGYYRRLVAAIIALMFFIGIVGISPTATRAGIMALCAFTARYYIRPYIITRGIGIALVIMAWISPYSLLFDVSLQLSFLATIGIVYVFPLLSEKFPRIQSNNFGEIFLQTVAVNSMTLPIIIYLMGDFSLISFPVNVLILSLIPWLTVGGFGSVFVGMVSVPLGKIFGFPIQVITQVIIDFATWVARHDPFRIVFQPFSVTWLLVVYGIMFFVLLIVTRITFKKVVKTVY